MPQVSMAGVGALITVAVTLLKLFGVELPEGTEAKVTEAIVTIVGIGLLVWGQVRRPDLVAGIFRK